VFDCESPDPPGLTDVPVSGSAQATPAGQAIADPIPNATASAPTRPMWRA
jgi:hypothetical protein